MPMCPGDSERSPCDRRACAPIPSLSDKPYTQGTWANSPSYQFLRLDTRIIPESRLRPPPTGIRVFVREPVRPAARRFSLCILIHNDG